MTKIEDSAMIDRSVAEVWGFVSDLSNTPKFDPTCVIEVKQTSDGPLGTGAVLLMRRMRYPREATFRVSGFEPNRRFTLEYVWSPLKGSDVGFILESVEGRTRLDLKWNLRYHGIGRLAAPCIARRIRRESAAFARNMKRTLESGTSGSPCMGNPLQESGRVPPVLFQTPVQVLEVGEHEGLFERVSRAVDERPNRLPQCVQ